MGPNRGPELEAGLGAPRRPGACPTCLIPIFMLQDAGARPYSVAGSAQFQQQLLRGAEIRRGFQRVNRFLSGFIFVTAAFSALARL